MTRRKKLTFAAGAAGIALVLAGLGAAGAVAASQLRSPSEESKAVIDDAAGQLGVEPGELSDALKQALKNRIEEAVDAGRLTQQQGNELEQRIDAAGFPLLGGSHLFGHGGRGFGPGFGHHDRFAILETAASYLGLTRAELRQQLRDGRTLAEIAKEKGRSVDGLVRQLVATQTRRIGEAVDQGRLTDEQATELENGLQERMEALVAGELRRHPDGPRPRFWPGSGEPRAPPLFGGPRA